MAPWVEEDGAEKGTKFLPQHLAQGAKSRHVGAALAQPPFASVPRMQHVTPPRLPLEAHAPLTFWPVPSFTPSMASMNTMWLREDCSFMAVAPTLQRRAGVGGAAGRPAPAAGWGRKPCCVPGPVVLPCRSAGLPASQPKPTAPTASPQPPFSLPCSTLRGTPAQPPRPTCASSWRAPAGRPPAPAG